MKCIHKVWSFIYMHPVWSMIIAITLGGMVTAGTDGAPSSTIFVIIFVFALLAPIIRKARKKQYDREQADYQAQQTAIELDKLQNPEKYTEKPKGEK